jgi:3-hydroxyisobutyrate dehydrogenase-like beta-hydroxyacid dehydrogenase
VKNTAHTPVALIGYGEAGHSFANAAAWRGRAVGFDIDPSRGPVMTADGVRPCSDMAEALGHAALLLSLVTADAALDVAQQAASSLRPGALFCDMNSVAPGTKREAADAIAAGGGRYVDVAVLAPVQPALMRVPLLVAGPDAEEAGALLRDLGFENVRMVGDQVGRASAIKMIRSVMVKGIEALTAEMMIAAEAAGVTNEVLASLDASERTIPWGARAIYNIERMTTHGLRRAAEMAESARTLEELGVEPLMTSGIVKRQRLMAGRASDWRTLNGGDGK